MFAVSVLKTEQFGLKSATVCPNDADGMANSAAKIYCTCHKYFLLNSTIMKDQS